MVPTVLLPYSFTSYKLWLALLLLVYKHYTCTLVQASFIPSSLITECGVSHLTHVFLNILFLQREP